MARSGPYDVVIMSDRDPAFLWETEAIRSAAHRVAEADLDAVGERTDAGRWVTLRQAARAVGIPVETLRKWARRGTVPTYLAPTDHGATLRMVDLAGVTARADELGRLPRSGGTITISVAEDDTEAPATIRPARSDVPPGSMIVPVDAWNKMLNQLGNLHEAGKQLAEARERAAKAETEARFLKERLAELRQREEPEPTPPPPEPAPEPATQPVEKVWHYLMRRVRDRRQG